MPDNFREGDKQDSQKDGKVRDGAKSVGLNLLIIDFDGMGKSIVAASLIFRHISTSSFAGS